MKFTDEQKGFLASEGNIILHACPGSGKTAVVAQKLISYIRGWSLVHQGVATLSFTNVASEEIEKQIQDLAFGNLTIDYPHYVGTLDSFINNFILLRFGYNLWNQTLRPKILMGNTLAPSFSYWKNECHKCKYVNDVSNFRWGIDGKLYYKKQIVNCQTKNARGNNPCFEYKKMMQKKGLLFQSEVAGFAHELLKKDPRIAEALAARFPVVIVDEAQDTSEEQMAVLDLLRQAGVESMFLVGDPDQSIYEWRDASPEYFVEKMNSDNWKTLRLTANFRSSQLICNATKLFSNSLKGRESSLAIGCSSNYKQRPVLLLYNGDINTIRATLIDKFLALCKENNIEPNYKKVAIVTRSKVSTTISSLWKTKEVELFAHASYEWMSGFRKKAYELCEKALFILLIDEFDNIEISIEHEIEKLMSYDYWRLIVIDMLTNLPEANQSVKSWVHQMQEVLSHFLLVIGFEIRDKRKVSDIIKTKARDQNVPDFKDLSINIFFESKIFSNYTLSSVHGVKGETYSALMLLIESTKGYTLTPSFLNAGNLDEELMRVAYVAMTRPKKLLVVAMPNSKNIKNYVRFPENVWEYIEF